MDSKIGTKKKWRLTSNTKKLGNTKMPKSIVDMCHRCIAYSNHPLPHVSPKNSDDEFMADKDENEEIQCIEC